MRQKFYTSPTWVSYLETQRSTLPVLPEVDDDLSKRVTRFLGANPGNMSLQGTNTYLIGTGSTRIMIDTGEGAPQWARNVTGYLDDHDISISHVLLTHWHNDHTGGVSDLLAHDSRIIVCKHMPEPGQQDIADGQLFQTQGATLRAVHTPGHSMDHMCFVLQEENALFTGDNVLGHGYSVAEDLEAYTTSLRVMAGLECAVGYPGHGQLISNLPKTISSYLAQRLTREKQIYAVLTRRSSYSATTNETNCVSSESSDDGDTSEDSHAERNISKGLSTADIGSIMYGAISKDQLTFESAVRPLLDQVLHMLLQRGKIGCQFVGSDHVRHWFATAMPV